jgi:hypothetical protein
VEADDAEEIELSLDLGAATDDDRPRFARVAADPCQRNPADWRLLSVQRTGRFDAYLPIVSVSAWVPLAPHLAAKDSSILTFVGFPEPLPQ